jgi:hypothetical protein
MFSSMSPLISNLVSEVDQCRDISLNSQNDADQVNLQQENEAELSNPGYLAASTDSWSRHCNIFCM